VLSDRVEKSTGSEVSGDSGGDLSVAGLRAMAHGFRSFVGAVQTAEVPSAEHADQWSAEHADQWSAEHADQWSAGHADQWSAEHADQWSAKHADQWSAEHADQWSAEHADQWSAEHADQWSAEVLDSWPEKLAAWRAALYVSGVVIRTDLEIIGTSSNSEPGRGPRQPRRLVVGHL